MIEIFHSVIRGLVELPKQLRWSYLPPLMVYLAAGVSGLTAIVGTFFIKDYLNLSAAFLASLGFWAGLPWALKMPLGHLVDLIWRQKAYLVGLGAAIIGASLLIMHGLIGHTAFMAEIMPVETWFVISVILGPVGYVIQDVVADAMTVEAVPEKDKNGTSIAKDQLKIMHTTMQTLGRFAIIGGTVLVSLVNVIMFTNVDNLDDAARIDLYADIYLYALIIPVISVAGVVLAHLQKAYNEAQNPQPPQSASSQHQRPEVNWSILIGSLVFVIFSLGVGTSGIGYAQEIVFAGSVGIILFLMNRLVRFLPHEQRMIVIGTAIIIFTFRAMPSPGPGLTWFEIDQLLRPFMANNSIAYIIVFLSIAGAVLFLPSVGMYYGLHEWTASNSGGIVDAKFIAIINTAVESPLGQVAMIPLLAWIARNAPAHLKATFFAVFASFTNLALSASALGTKYLNEAFVVTREVKDKLSGAIITTADYSELGLLLITVLLITLTVPIGMVIIIQNSRFKTND